MQRIEHKAEQVSMQESHRERGQMDFFLSFPTRFTITANTLLSSLLLSVLLAP